jgi:hypothetical protein
MFFISQTDKIFGLAHNDGTVSLQLVDTTDGPRVFANKTKNRALPSGTESVPHIAIGISLALNRLAKNEKVSMRSVRELIMHTADEMRL